MYRAFGVAGGLLGSSSLAPSRTLIAPAAVLTTEGASGGQGNTLGASVMRVNSNAAEGATSHEVLHTLGLPDNGYDKGGLLNSPPGSISTSEVDDALKYSYKKE
jgi:hypothetical protein